MTNRPTLTIGVAALAAVVAISGCSTSTSNQAGTTTTSVTASPSAAAAHNQEDIMFAQHMIPHHQQAIQMSDIVLAKQGIDPRVVDLANQIKAAQGPEIQQMQGWLTQWGQPTMPMMPSMMPSTMPNMMPSPTATPGPPPDTHHTSTPSPTPAPGQSGMPGMPGQSGMPGMSGMEGMQGMMSEQDMAALQNAQGVEASKLFLSQMIQHHQGAIAMAQHEINAGGYHPAAELARSITTSQQQEIKTMQSILSSL